jgi:hypothetical protein
MEGASHTSESAGAFVIAARMSRRSSRHMFEAMLLEPYSARLGSYPNGNPTRRPPETDAARTVGPGPHHESRAKGFPTHLDGKSSARFGRDVETHRQPRLQGTNFGTETEGEQAGGHRCRVRSKRSQGPQHASARDATNVSATPVANAKATPERTLGSSLLQGPCPNGGAGRDAEVGGSAPISPPS